MAAPAPTDAAKRRAAVDAAYGSLAHLPMGFDFRRVASAAESFPFAREGGDIGERKVYIATPS